MSMPTTMPDKLEAGNLNVPALAGWTVGLPDDAEVRRREWMASGLAERLHTAVAGSGMSATSRGELPIVSFWCDELDATELAMILAGEFGIEVRSGHHCAAGVVAGLGGPPGGVVRASAGPETKAVDLDSLGAALREILRG